MPLTIASPEDLIIAKLRWAPDTDSERQLRDVAAIIRTSRESMDWTYLTPWVERLGLDGLLKRAEGMPDAS